MNYLFTVTTIARSAAEVLAVLDRQARKDTRKVVRPIVRLAQILTGKQAIATYRSLGQLFMICCQVAIALGMTARDAWEWAMAKLDAYAASCEAQPEITEAIEAAEEPAMEHRIVPFQRPAMAQATAMVVELFASMSAVELRRECAKLGVKWRNAHGDNKHLSKDEMLSALMA